MSATHIPRVLVLGHSFVRRLEHFMGQTSLPCVENNFALPSSTELKFHGIGGRTLPLLLRYDLPVIRAFKPTVILLEIGSNDLCNPNIATHELANDIVQLIVRFHFQFGVDHVILGQILPRITPPPQCPDYNARVHALNRILLTCLKYIHFATIWFHLKVTNHSLLLFANDGVHLNMAGNHLLHHSYRNALSVCQRRLTRLATNRRRLLSRRATWSTRPRQALRYTPS